MSRILMAASEAAPFSKTGGLADVLGSLPKALAARGEKVAVVTPLYGKAGHYPDQLAVAYHDLYVHLGTRHHITHIRHCQSDGVEFFFVDEPSLFGRDALYGTGGEDYPDNHIRFGVFSHAVLGVIRHLFRPQVIHCHDWQAALLPPLIRHEFRLDPTFYGMKILLTLHNLGYQGLFDSTIIDDLALDPALFRSDLLEFYGQVNLLKGGIVFSDAISTVSRGYAREIQTPELGFGLDGLLRARAADLTGIVNGVDYSEWSPERDRFIGCKFSASDLAPKRECKRELLEAFGLPSENLDRPLIGMVSRFVQQKGLDIIAEVAEQIAQEHTAFVALGSGQPEYEAALQQLAASYPERIAVRIGYDNPLAHKIEAGSDIFLMPSQYEPCGLNQIYSLRYGTLPIVRATGGLDDTIDAETGFKFDEYTGAALLAAVRTALAAYADQPRWQRMMQTAMRRDFSWDHAAAEYSELYARLLGSRGQAA